MINNLIATKNCFNHFNVSWDHMGDVVNITLMRSNALLSTDVTSNDNYYYNNLTAGGNYTITVSGCNNVGCNSDSVNISVSNIIPGSKLYCIHIMKHVGAIDLNTCHVHTHRCNNK